MIAKNQLRGPLFFFLFALSLTAICPEACGFMTVVLSIQYLLPTLNFHHLIKNVVHVNFKMSEKKSTQYNYVVFSNWSLVRYEQKTNLNIVVVMCNVN